MKRTNLCVTLMSAVLCLSAQAADVKKVGNIVTIRPNGGQAKVIQLEVINDNIIRVRATSKAELPVKPASLMIVPQATYKGSVTVNDGPEAVEVKARNVWAVVSKAEGEKCDRCWMFVTDVEKNGEGCLCKRCAKIVS